MTIFNDVTTVANLHTGEIALIITEARGNTPAFAQAVTVEAVYRDAPGWIVEYRYTAATSAGGAVLHGSKYYRHADDQIDVISVQERSNA